MYKGYVYNIDRLYFLVTKQERIIIMEKAYEISLHMSYTQDKTINIERDDVIVILKLIQSGDMDNSDIDNIIDSLNHYKPRL